MKKIFIMMFALVSLTASAQVIKSGSKWNISNLVYEAKVNTDKTITFTAMAEGEELAFRLTPNNSKKNEYVLSEDQNADGFNPFSKTPRAKYIVKEGWKLICLYDQKGDLHNVLDGSFFGEGEKVAMGKWMEQIMGKYTDSYGDTLEIGHEIIYEKGVARAEYKNIAFNGTVTGVLRISGLTDLEGTWEAVQTLDGLTLIEVEQDEYGMFKRKDQKKTLSWVNTEPRFGYANRILLNDKLFQKMPKSTLRIMRNSILARHGYMFSSRDLADYFASQPWFSPRPSNDGINDELSLVESLNIELIKQIEGNKSGEAKTDDISELVFVPDLSNIKPLDLSDGKDKAAQWFPVWDEGDVYEDEGVLHYDLNLGYNVPLQQLYKGLPGKPNDKKEVNRVILIDLNKDGYTDALVCLGRYGSEKTLYFDAYLWDEEDFGGLFTFVKGFRQIPNPRIDKKNYSILGRNGNDCEVWLWKGKNRIEKSQVKKDYYKK